MDSASITVIKLIKRVNESIRTVLSTLSYSSMSCRITSAYLMYFDVGEFPFTVSSSTLIGEGN